MHMPAMPTKLKTAGSILMNAHPIMIAEQVIVVATTSIVMVQESQIGAPVPEAKSSTRFVITVVIVSIPNYIRVPIQIQLTLLSL